jgi:signal transduction histidine kinase
MAILGSLENRKQRALEGQNVVDLIDNAIIGAKRGASLTQRLLAFSRKQDLKLEVVDAPALVREMAGLLQRSIGPNIEISTTFPLSLPPVRSDPNQLESALLNLVVNARDTMPNGGIIAISARKHSLKPKQVPDLPEGDYVCLSLKTRAKAWMPKCWKRLRHPSSRPRAGKGTGLGLSMVQVSWHSPVEGCS